MDVVCNSMESLNDQIAELATRLDALKVHL